MYNINHSKFLLSRKKEEEPAVLSDTKWRYLMLSFFEIPRRSLLSPFSFPLWQPLLSATRAVQLAAALRATCCCKSCRSFAFIFHLSSFHFDILCCPQPARCNLQLHYARPVAAKAVEAFSFRVIFYTRRRWISKITLYLQSVLCIEQINT